MGFHPLSPYTLSNRSKGVPMFGKVLVDGVEYIERKQTFSERVQITSNEQVVISRVSLPGVADFMLKGLTRQSIAANAAVDRAFLFRWGNSDGGEWYTAAGLGGATERVLDTLTFGDGRFPYPIFPPLHYSRSASITYEVEDLSNSVPYDIFIAWQGNYLIPIAGNGNFAA